MLVDLQIEIKKSLVLSDVSDGFTGGAAFARTLESRPLRWREYIVVVGDEPSALVCGLAHAVQQQHLRINARQPQAGSPLQGER